MSPVVPPGKALLERFHEGGDIVHACPQPCFPPCRILGILGQNHRQIGGIGKEARVALPIDQRIAAQQLRPIQRLAARLRHPDKNVEMVAHDTVSEHFDPREAGNLPQHFPHDLASVPIEQPLCPRHPGNTVINTPTAVFDSHAQLQRTCYAAASLI